MWATAVKSAEIAAELRGLVERRCEGEPGKICPVF